MLPISPLHSPSPRPYDARRRLHQPPLLWTSALLPLGSDSFAHASFTTDEFWDRKEHLKLEFKHGRSVFLNKNQSRTSSPDWTEAEAAASTATHHGDWASSLQYDTGFEGRATATRREVGHLVDEFAQDWRNS